jgi:predicted RNase H-like nuclease
VNHRDRKNDSPLSAEAVETLVWLAGSAGVERRGYAIVNRLRRVRESDGFASLPEDLRERVREILADTAR